MRTLEEMVDYVLSQQESLELVLEMFAWGSRMIGVEPVDAAALILIVTAPELPNRRSVARLVKVAHENGRGNVIPFLDYLKHKLSAPGADRTARHQFHCATTIRAEEVLKARGVEVEPRLCPCCDNPVQA